MTRSEWNIRAAPATTAAVHATALCPKSHRWPVRAYLRKLETSGLFGSFVETAKVVDTEHCPQCGERWDELLDGDGVWNRAVDFFGEV